MAIALGCKETAVSSSSCAALVLFIDRDRAEPRRVTNVAALTGGLIAAYLRARRRPDPPDQRVRRGRLSFSATVPRSSRTSLPILASRLALEFPRSSSFHSEVRATRSKPSAPHLVLIGLILRRAGPKWTLIYLIAFYATLLPVLPISKHETQYTYAGSIALALALALLWERKSFVAVPVAVLTLVLVAHSLTIQQWMYGAGVCQTRALDTLNAVLKDIAPEVPLTILVRDDTPWWVIARAVHDNSFPLRGEFMKVSVTRDPGNAGMVFHSDCAVSAR